MVKLAEENRMVERRDAGRSHSQQYSSVRDRWFRKLDELQAFVTTECFRSHRTHISSPVFVGCISVWRHGPGAFTFVSINSRTSGPPDFVNLMGRYMLISSLEFLVPFGTMKV